MSAPTEHKLCPSCNLSLPLDSFQTDRRLSTGLKTYCRSCANAKTRDWQKRNPEKRRAAKVSELEREKEKRRLASEARPPKPPLAPWHKRNPEKFRASQKKHRQKYADKYKAANTAWKTTFRTNNPEAHRLRTWNASLSVMGHTIESYQSLETAQGGRCAICHQPNNQKRKLAIDHDHSCCGSGKACSSCQRGLLCCACNTALNKLEKTKGWIHEALAYLEKHAKRE